MASGLGEVVSGLSRELELQGHAVDIILPKYNCMRYDQIYQLTVAYHDLWVPWYSGFVHCTVWFGLVHGRWCYFIEPHSQDNSFNRGHLYGSVDDVTRFAFFAKAAMEFMLKTNRRPEVIHCHDWQTALCPPSSTRFISTWACRINASATPSTISVIKASLESTFCGPPG